ncbi:1534_t:CDS:2 [Entrophospora sp. SA101]|nr:1534_t:CDS:2 [Entrophospora sp. SA101]
MFSKLEQINQELQEILQSEVAINKSNEKYIKDLECKYTRCEKEIQSLNKELERLENASEKEKAELRSEILSLKRSLYQAKKEIRDKISYTDNIEKQLQESEERVQNLRHRFKVISSRRSSPSLYNSEEEDTDMAHIDPFINITRGLNRLENHFTGGTPLNNPANIIQGMYGTLNTIRANYQRIDQDLDDVTNQRDARDAQIVQLQQDVNYFRQQNIALQNHVNQLTLERNNSQNDLALMTTAYYNEREERRHWWRVAKQLEKGMQVRINTLLLDKFALIFKLRRCQSHGRELQQKYDMRGQLWHNASLVWEDQSKLKRILEIIYKVSTHRLKQELQRCHNHGAMLEYWHDRRLPVLKLIQPALASFPPYIGQEPPDDYLDKVVQSWAFAEGHMTVLENAHAGDFDDAVKCTILKSKMAGKYAPLETNSHQLQNKSQSDNDSIRAEIKSMIKSELAVVPTTSLQPTQFQKTQALQSRQKQSDPIDYPRVPDKYMPERPPDGYGVYSEKNIHANLINPTPTSNQVIESVAKDVYEKVMDKISSFLPKKKNNTPNNDDMDEITKGMSELSINKAIAKGISQGIKAVHDNNVSSQHRCSNCYSLGHNSRKCPYPRKRNRKNRKSRSKKRGSVNKVAVDSGSDTNSSDNDSSDNNSDSGDSSSEVESDHSFDNIMNIIKLDVAIHSMDFVGFDSIPKNIGIIQRAWRRFQEKEPSNAQLAWNSLPNDNTPDDKKFLGLTQHKIKNPQTREQFNQWRTKWIELYKNDPMMRSSIINRQYEEYYIPYNWIDSKKSQLWTRFQKRLLEIEA